MKRKILTILIPVLALIIISSTSYSFYKSYQKRHQITLYGNVDIREVSASFRASGRLKKLFFDEGDFVKEGELLATLESDTFGNELELAKANFNAAKADMENAERKFQRTANLFKNDSVTKQEYENDRFSSQQARANLAAQKAKVKISQTAYDDTNLYAPSDAFVMTRAFEKGSMLAQNQTVFELSLTNQAYVRAYVDEEDLGRIESGMSVKILTDSNEEYEGQIGFISPKAEFTPKSVETVNLRTDLVYRLRITIKNPNAKLKQGMPVTILIKL